MKNILWAGRFKKPPAKKFMDFTASDDFRLWREDICGNRIQAKVLHSAGILSQSELKKILSALSLISRELERKGTVFLKKYEDIHSAIEGMLVEKTGKCGEKIHTGRSRNDQVSLDLRLFVAEKASDMSRLTKVLSEIIKKMGKKYDKNLMPAYTHMQHAVPVSVEKYITAYCEMLIRDSSAFIECAEIAGHMPLGSGAVGGTTVKIDRKKYLKFSGMKKLTSNSVDAVSDRDFLINFVFCCAAAMTHLSRLSEDMVIWASSEFGFLILPDSFSSGSSMMPQKKNPDAFELIRGKSARCISALTGILTVFKGLPLSYNRDMQEDKHYLFTAYDTLKASLELLIEMLPECRLNTSNMKKQVSDGFIIATEIAESLVNAGIPFRSAHRITGKMVRYALESGKTLYDLTAEEKKKIAPEIHWEKINFPGN